MMESILLKPGQVNSQVMDIYPTKHGQQVLIFLSRL